MFGCDGFGILGVEIVVCRARGVVLIGETAEGVAELVHQEVAGERAVGGEGAEAVVEPATAVAVVVDHDHEGVVRDIGGDVAQRPVGFGQEVAW